MPRKPELTFQKSRQGIGGRWKKMYRGKMYYLGTARCKSDLNSYRQAVEKWQALKALIDADTAQVQRPYDESYDNIIHEWELVLSWSTQNSEQEDADLARRKIAELKVRREQSPQRPVIETDRLWSRFRIDPRLFEDLSKMLAAQKGQINFDELRTAILRLGPIQRDGEIPVSTSSITSLEEERIRWEDRLRYQEQMAAETRDRTIGPWIDAYLDRYRKRMEAGDISVGVVVAERAKLEFVREWAGSHLRLDEINGSLLTRLHSFLLEKIANEECSPTYAKERLSSFKALIRWLWGQDVLPSLPKNIDSHELRISRRPVAPQIASLDTIRTIIKQSEGVTRLYVLLALNCGMTQKDIADLQQRDVDWKSGTITRKRSKTHKHDGVPTVTYKLWPETFALLQEFRSDSPRVLVNRNGAPLVEEKLVNGQFRKNDNIKNAYERVLKKVGLRSPFKLMRKTSATLIHGHERFRGLDSLFLGHAPATIAERHYSATSPDALNASIDYLRAAYGIEEVTNTSPRE